MAHFQIRSASEQVAAHLKDEVERGTWSGTMPGEERLMRRLGVGAASVREALKQLEHEGLLVGQGTGRRRKIVLPESHTPTALRVGVLVYDLTDQDYIVDLRHLLEKAGHTPFFPDKTLMDLGMGVRRVARLVQNTEADAWVVASASREVLKWFVEYEKPAFALFGRRGTLPIAGVGPDHEKASCVIVRRLVALGHQRIIILARENRRLPEPGLAERAVFEEMAVHGLATSAYNLPDWEDTPEGFLRLLDELFRVTPPTALIIDEPFLFHAAKDHLAQRGILAPAQVSLICTDPDPTFAWCRPTIAHLNWDSRPVVRRVVRWVDNVAKGKNDQRQTLTKIEFIEGGTVGPAPAPVGWK